MNMDVLSDLHMTFYSHGRPQLTFDLRCSVIDLEMTYSQFITSLLVTDLFHRNDL